MNSTISPNSRRIACRYSTKQTQSEIRRKITANYNDDSLRQQVLSRARMFSPSSCVKNIRDFKQKVLESRKSNIEINSSDNSTDEDSNNPKDGFASSMKYFQEMAILHQNLIFKTSKLIEGVKRGQFEGFFSPRRLRNRIKLGNLSQIPCNENIFKRRAFSPCNRTEGLSSNDSTQNSEASKIVKSRNIPQHIISKLPTNIVISLKANHHKSKSDNIQNICADTTTQGRRSLFSDQKIKSNFYFQKKSKRFSS